MECKNCKTELNNTINYCSNCGAKVIRNRITTKHLAKDFSEQVLSYDNKLLVTFLALFKKPDDVINGFLNGTRKKYLNVIQYFAISLTLAGLQVFLMTTYFHDQLFDSFSSYTINEVSNEKMQDIMNLQTKVFDYILNYQNLIYIFSVPIYAFASWLTIKIFNNKKKYNYTEHIVINLYYSAQIIIITSILSITFLFLGFNYNLISAIVTLFSIIYLVYLFRKVFSLSKAHTLAFGLILMVFSGIIFIVIGIIGIIFGIIYAKTIM